MAKITTTIESDSAEDHARAVIELAGMFGVIDYNEIGAPVLVTNADAPAPPKGKGGRPRKTPEAAAPPATAASGDQVQPVVSLLGDGTDPGPTAPTPASPSDGALTEAAMKAKMTAAMQATTPLITQNALKEAFGEDVSTFSHIPLDKWPEAATVFDNLVAGAALSS